MRRKVYVVQPTYRSMDGKLLKGLPLFNFSYNLPILNAVIPSDWEKEFCLEYCDELDLASDASVVILTSTGYEIAHAVEIAEHFRARGSTVIFGAHMDGMSDRVMRQSCDSAFLGYPNHEQMATILEDAIGGRIKPEYDCGMNIDYPFDYSVLKGKKMWFIPMMASLGCKNSCSYCCSTSLTSAGYYRLRHVSHVMADLRAAAEFRRPLGFLDANLYNNRNYLIMLLEQMIEAKLKLRWGCHSTIDIADDREALSLLKKAGCRILFIGLETLDSQNMLQLTKPYDPGQYLKQVKAIREHGIMVGAHFMMGLDNDDPSSFEKLNQFYKESRVEVPYTHMFVPIPGTPLYKTIRSAGRLHNESYDNYSKDNAAAFSVPCSVAYFRPAKMTEEELEQNYLELNGRVLTLPKIFRRSLKKDFIESGLVLAMNLEARKKYKAMRTAKLQKVKGNAVLSSE
jgi:radical SAM superfamily enzyme YgiQ (UPF0313 family)